MKKFLLYFLLVVFCTTTYAVPTKRGTFTVTQPDGTELTICRMGDEFFHYTTTEDGFLVKKNEANVYEYAEFDTHTATTKSLGVKANNIAKRSAEEKSLLANIDRNAMHNYAIAQRQAAKAQKSAKKSAGSVNIVPKGLVILVNFSDTKFTQADPQSYFDDLMNKEGFNTNGGYGSVRDYFKASSGNQYAPEFKVVGPYTVSKTADYYATGNGAVTDIENDEDYGIYNVGYMINEACSLAYADGVSFADYDLDNDGEVDYIYVIYAGHNSAEWAEHTIWPHSWYVSVWISNASQRTYGGYTVDLYACSSELRGETGNNLCGIATFCHEFSHVLGLPDYYDTNYGTNVNSTPGAWTLMDQGSYNNDGLTPPVYSAYDRYYMGWLTPTIMNSAENVTLEDLQTTNTARVVTSSGTLPSATSTSEAYYFENRQQQGWDEYLPGHGMLVTKVKYNSSAWQSNIVNNGTTMYYDIVEAEGKKSAGGDDSDPFPGTANKTSYTPVSGYPLTEITETDGTITFKFMGGIDCDGYTVYFSGDKCTLTSDLDCLADGETYTATLTPANGYLLSSSDILITMGGADLTEGVDFTYDGTTLTIANVTGNIEIVAIAQKNPDAVGEVYVKVTSAPDDWSGEYLIVYEAGSVVLDGSLTTLDAASNNQSVTITNYTIEAVPNDAYRFIIEKSGSNYTIQSASGYYIGNTSNSNALNTSTTTAYTNTISLGSDGVVIKSSGGAYLRYNATSSQNRFRYFKSSTYTAQKPVQLYKKLSSSTTSLNMAQSDDLISLATIEGGIRLQNIPANADISIFNAAGQIVSKQTACSDSQTFGLQRGVYIIRITTNQINKTIKAIVK